jgi:hypothetical protein
MKRGKRHIENEGITPESAENKGGAWLDFGITPEDTQN